jgi:Protein NO VEIN, C-terminal
MEWGEEAEARAMEWLRKQGRKPINDSHLNKGWDIACGDDKFEVKGRKSKGTAIRLSQNEWAAAKRLKKRYTVLVFTAATKGKLHRAMPKQIADPASNPESWQPRVVYEYILVE